MSFLLPVLALHTLDTLLSPPIRRSCFLSPLSYYPNHFNHTPCWHTRRVIPLNFHWNFQTPSRMQETSLKVNDSQFFWEGNCSPLDLNHFLDGLEKTENRRSSKSPEKLEGIKAARSIVAQATTTFNEIEAFETKLIKMKNELRKQTKTEDVKSQLALVKGLLADVTKIILPAELTEVSIEAYTAKAKETLQRCEKQLDKPEQNVPCELSSENEKTKAQGAAVISSLVLGKDTSDKTVETVIGPVETPPEPIVESITKPATDVAELANEPAIGPTDDLETKQISAETEACCLESSTQISDPIKETETASEAADLIKKDKIENENFVAKG